MRIPLAILLGACALFFLLPTSHSFSATTAKWPAISTKLKIVEYPIEANSYSEALVQCAKHGKEGWPGYTTWDLKWTYSWDPYDNIEIDDLGNGTKRVTLSRLKINVTTVEVTQVVYLPKLKMGKKFPKRDKKRWKTWLKSLREHEEYHMRVSSVLAIETWLKNRVANMKSVSATYKEDREIDDALKESLIQSKLSEVYQHAIARIKDKNRELDQLTDHRLLKMNWKKFLAGYF